MPSSLDVLATSQCGVLRRDQLRSCGISEARIRAQLDAFRWRAVGPLVVTLHNGPLTLAQRQWATLLNAGTPAALGGRTALWLYGLKGWESDAVHVVVPRGNAPPAVPELRQIIHETRRDDDHRFRVGGCPGRTTVERSAIDAGLWSRSSRTACGVLAAVVQQRLTTAERLLSALASAGRVRHRRAMRLTLVDIAGGAQALSEIDFTRLCRRYHLGVVAHQQVRTDGSGKRRYLDGVIRGPKGASVAFESMARHT